MAESNDNWECIGKVDFFWYGYQSVDLYVKSVNGVPFYKVWESVVYKSTGEHNAYIKAEKIAAIFVLMSRHGTGWNKSSSFIRYKSIGVAN